MVQIERNALRCEWRLTKNPEKIKMKSRRMGLYASMLCLTMVAGGAWAAEQDFVLLEPRGVLLSGTGGSLAAVDLNADGNWDVIISTPSRRVVVHFNKGTNAKPVFGDAEPVKYANGKPMTTLGAG